MNQIEPNGKSKYQNVLTRVANMKTSKERSNIAYARENRLKSEIDPITGRSSTVERALRSSATKTTRIDPETGLNIHQVAGRKSYNTMLTSIDEESGLSRKEIQNRNHSIKLNEVTKSGLTLAQEIGKKSLETKLKEDEYGLNSFDRMWIKHSKMHQYKDYNVFYQSTSELSFLINLEELYGSLWFSENVRRGPAVRYQHPSGSEKIFMIDFKVGDRFIEVKSSYTYDGNGKRPDFKQINEAKIDGARKINPKAYIVIC
jgi:hypothetical protein